MPVGKNDVEFVPHENYTYPDYRVVDNTTGGNNTGKGNDTLVA